MNSSPFIYNFSNNIDSMYEDSNTNDITQNENNSFTKSVVNSFDKTYTTSNVKKNVKYWEKTIIDSIWFSATIIETPLVIIKAVYRRMGLDFTNKFKNFFAEYFLSIKPMEIMLIIDR